MLTLYPSILFIEKLLINTPVSNEVSLCEAFIAHYVNNDIKGYIILFYMKKSFLYRELEFFDLMFLVPNVSPYFIVRQSRILHCGQIEFLIACHTIPSWY